MHVDCMRAWEAVLVAIEVELGEAPTHLWFANSQLILSENDELRILFPNAFTRDWVQRNHLHRIERLLETVLGHSVHVSFGLNETPLPSRSSTQTRNRSPRNRKRWNLQVEPIAGPFNQVALSSLRHALEFPGETQPILIYGENGLGKTTLLDWYARALKFRHPGWRIKHLRGSTYSRRFQQALVAGQIRTFRQVYRKLDALLVDDIHELCGKMGTQQELIHTMDHLIRRQAPILFTSRHQPTDLELFSEPLRCRLRGGLSLPIERPCPQSIRDYLSIRCGSSGIHLDSEVLDYLSEQFRGPFSQIDHLVKHLSTLSQQSNRPPGKRIVKRAIELYMERIENRTLAGICRITAEFFSFDVEYLRGRTRERSITSARRVAMYLASELTEASPREIGRYFSDRSPATVKGACRWVRSHLKQDSAFREQCNALRKIL
ncbi:MAG: DnaA/Hda family protein [Planctomycetota bacterium]|nr:DnaA/Hda family protein [Planctomycetota bacterium]